MVIRCLVLAFVQLSTLVWRVASVQSEVVIGPLSFHTSVATFTLSLHWNTSFWTICFLVFIKSLVERMAAAGGVNVHLPSVLSRFVLALCRITFVHLTSASTDVFIHMKCCKAVFKVIMSTLQHLFYEEALRRDIFQTGGPGILCSL